ncbi:hypothetical protein BDA99DRAFT_42793 [Phascolomyces articulosus]|uniref:Chromo domain-containing protein n=1 Tax=Phascolomyces articulosus TaxID=60185 RepID=A0AAD5K1X5_9FUNG|nr:hypothetical protein BDA99DRAFT_42793 [Phascolomyces articulosus]
MSDINLTSSDSTSEDEYEVERIVDHRKVGKKLQYYIKWKDYSDEDNTWESEANVFATSLINEYWTDRGGREGMEAARKGKKLQKSKTTTSKGKQRKLPKAASKLSSSSSSSFSSSSSSYAPSSFTLASKRTRTPDVSQSVDKITEESSQGSVKRARTGSTQGGNDMVINEARTHCTITITYISIKITTRIIRTEINISFSRG